MSNGAILIVAALSAFCVSVVVVAASIAYAHRRGLLDQPGQRRSHTRPTPRGGGIGIVAAALLCALPALLLLPQALPVATIAVLALALLAVAGVGWRDDHGGLPVLPRFVVHLIAVAATAAALFVSFAHGELRFWWLLAVVAIVFAGSINLHNFMDGIDGLLGLQALFVFAGYALLGFVAGETAVAASAIAIAAACLGFLLFNLPPARIFMGDVGSGALGLLVAAYGGLLVSQAPELLWPCLILSSAFFVDSGLTLLQRVLAGKRWYTAHREHLYQWMTRARGSHARTDGVYMLWNLIIAAPAAWAAVSLPVYGPMLCVAVYAFGAVLWLFGKRACLARARGRTHVVA